MFDSGHLGKIQDLSLSLLWLYVDVRKGSRPLFSPAPFSLPRTISQDSCLIPRAQ